MLEHVRPVVLTGATSLGFLVDLVSGKAMLELGCKLEYYYMYSGRAIGIMKGRK